MKLRSRSGATQETWLAPKLASEHCMQGGTRLPCCYLRRLQPTVECCRCGGCQTWQGRPHCQSVPDTTGSNGDCLWTSQGRSQYKRAVTCVCAQVHAEVPWPHQQGQAPALHPSKPRLKTASAISAARAAAPFPGSRQRHTFIDRLEKS